MKFLIYLALIAQTLSAPKGDITPLLVMPGTVFTAATSWNGVLTLATLDGRVIQDGRVITTLPVKVKDEGGLNAIAVHDNQLYALGIGLDNELTMWRNGLPVLKMGQAGNRHNAGGLLAHGDSLYIGLGDQNPQRDVDALHALYMGSYYGKILRFVPSTSAISIYARGFRNPWSLTWAKGSLYAVDVGEQRVEELNRVESGGTYGWPCYEGGVPNLFEPTVCPSIPNTLPEASYGHDRGQAVVGAVWRDGWLLFDFTGAVVDAPYISPYKINGITEWDTGIVLLSFGRADILR